MIRTVAVVGANGRVGAVLVRHLAERLEVVPIVRSADESAVELSLRAATGTDVVVNAAGVAHVERPTVGDIARLRAGNVELPLALADAALAHRISLVHVSSVKAARADESPYAASKLEAEEQLEARFSHTFALAGTSLVILRPLAMLFPPFDAGKLRHLRAVRFWPARLTPPVPLPVITPGTLFDSVDRAIDSIDAGTAPVGLSRIVFGPEDRGSLRDVRLAMIAAHSNVRESDER